LYPLSDITTLRKPPKRTVPSLYSVSDIKQLYAAMTIVLPFWPSEIFEVALISSFMLPLFDIDTYRVISSVTLLRKTRNQINFCELVIFGYTRFTEVLVLFHFVLNIAFHLSVLF